MRLLMLILWIKIMKAEFFDDFSINISKYPYLAKIQKFDDNGYNIFTCSGSIVNNYFVLTSAQCFMNGYNVESVEKYLVFAGLSILEGSQVSKIHKLHIHPRYNMTKYSSTRFNDICLVELDKILVYNNNVRPVVLSRGSMFNGKVLTEYFSGEYCVVTKWGCSDVYNVSLRYFESTYLSIVGNRECSILLSMEDTQLCTKFVNLDRKKFCPSDIGIPLVCKGYQIGLLSSIFGVDIWTRVDSYYNWILQVSNSREHKKYKRDTKIDCNNNVNDFSHMATIQKVNIYGYYTPSCSGSIISNYLVLTTAQCFANENIETLPRYIIYAGLSKKSHFSQSSQIDKLYLHPKYHDVTKHNDIGVIKLKKKLVFNSEVKPIFLAEPNINKKFQSDYARSKLCTVTKWSCPQVSSSLYVKCYTLPILKKSQCEEHLVLDHTQLCTNIESIFHTGFCVSDIGAPLIFQGYQVGILSWSFKVDIWTKIIQYSNWIKHIMDVYDNKTNIKKPNEKNIKKKSYNINITSIPFVVSIQKRDENGQYNPSCSGSVINHNFILTAAQCFMNNDRPELLDLYLVRASNSEITDLRDSNTHQIDAVYIYPDYKSLTKTDNIALAKLKTELNKNKNPVALAQSSMFLGKEPNVYYLEGDCFVVSWGCSKRPTFLKLYPMHIISNFECEPFAKSINTKLYTQICTKFAFDFCGSDIGDPLICKDRQVGILSWPIGTDIWTRVDKYYDWIIRITKSVKVSKNKMVSTTTMKHITTVKSIVNLNSNTGFPFIVSIQKINDNVIYYPVCSGTIIRNNLVLTSAQCFLKNEQMKLLHLYLVRAGLKDMLNLQNSQYSKIDAVHVHPGYKYMTKTNDIAVVKLRINLIFNEYIQPVNLVKMDTFNQVEPDRYFKKGECFAARWNCTISPVFTINFTLPVIPKSECVKFVYVDNSQLCTYFQGNRSEFCAFDVGDPLICNGMQIGILSWSFGINVWTRVDKYYGWISGFFEIEDEKNQLVFAPTTTKITQYASSTPVSKSLTPFLVSLQKKQYDGNYFPACTGTVITSLLILTAAQCFVNNVNVSLNMFIVRSGLTDVTNLRTFQTSEISEVYIHPKYHYKSKTHDIAIAKLKTKIKFLENMNSVHLAEPNMFGHGDPGEDLDKECFVARWGCTLYPVFVKLHSLPIITKNKCQKFVFILDSQLCTYFVKMYTNEFCPSDTGDPLICNGRQVGVLSWSFGIDIWTRIDKHYDWIKQIYYKETYNITRPKTLYPVTDSYNKNTEQVIKYTTTPKFKEMLPSIVLIEKKDKTDSYIPACSGSIINQQYILSSAQCFTVSNEIPLLHLYHVIAGITDSTNIKTSSQISEIQNIFLHPGYRYATQTHDINVIKLKKPLIFNDFVKPSNLAQNYLFLEKEPEEFFNKDRCIAATWTCTNEHNSTSLKIIPITIIPKTKCENRLSLKTTQLCTNLTSTYSDGFCLIDIGSPLICEGFQIGLLSWSYDLDIWTRIDQYSDWIKQIIESNKNENRTNEKMFRKNSLNFETKIEPERAPMRFRNTGYSNEDKIHISQFPYMVSIHKINHKKKFVHHCVGSILNNVLILTSGSCFFTTTYYTKFDDLNDYIVYAGVSDLRKLDSQLSKIEMVHIKPNINVTYKRNNVAIVKLKNKLFFNENVKPISLIPKDYFGDKEPVDFFNNNECFIYKWDCTFIGYTADSFSTTLRSVQISLHKYEKCKKSLEKMQMFGEMQMCTCLLEVDANGFCFKNAGNPLICRDVQIALLSHSFILDVWTRVDIHYDWIQEVNETYNSGKVYDDANILNQIVNSFPKKDIDVSVINNMVDLVQQVSKKIVNGLYPMLQQSLKKNPNAPTDQVATTADSLIKEDEYKDIDYGDEDDQDSFKTNVVCNFYVLFFILINRFIMI